MKRIEMTGKRFGRLVVTKFAYTKYIKPRCARAMWYCNCDCGNEDIIVEGYKLRSGNTQSCGCLRLDKLREAIVVDLTNKKFGKLTALYPVTDTSKGRMKWFCKCDCENTCIVDEYHLQSGNTQSCGCIKSKGEEKIQKILSDLGIKFHKEHTFQDCINPETGAKLKFDFYLKDYNICIEYNGIQHYQYREGSYFSKEAVLGIQKRDKIKQDYCRHNSIPLIIIPYIDIDDIDDNYLLQKIFSKGV